MKARHGNNPVREQLKAELAGVRFSEEMQRQVMMRLDPAKTPFWERELAIPFPAAAGWGLLCAMAIWLLFALPLSAPSGKSGLTDAARHPEQAYEGQAEQPAYVSLAGNVFRSEELNRGWRP
ncbi:hypothetical protein N0M98_03660 [Paenibacillus doosanensis]|uniref:Uncharacterized protein n=1 Tax=Paenibacillus konkukensis TaxID=2020716 RepID=A0ABY4RP87_9BACL|nr:MULTISPECIES: hypothetical protein [Paenibacillus]MCS7459228.1 hypothetical protein [Paenibacillus doosanensis]UQZ84279.1 hypothetical protein SK3146_03514 [Paenibacillus konkukensis]